MRWRTEAVNSLSSELLDNGYTYSVCAEDHDRFKKLVNVRGYSVQFDAVVRDPGEDNEAQIEMGFYLALPNKWGGGVIDYLINAIHAWRRETESEMKYSVEERVGDSVPLVVESNIEISTPKVMYSGTDPSKLEDKLTKMANRMVARGYQLHPFERI